MGNSLKGRTVQPGQKSTLCNIPLEILDIILRRSYLRSVLREDKPRDQRDRDVIEKLATVDFCFFNRIRKRRFKNSVNAQLSRFYKNTFKLQTVIRSNQQYLVENIRPVKMFIEKLVSSNNLTQEQIDSIDKLCKGRDKVSEILFALRPLNEKTYDALIRCLQQTDQHQVATVMDKGGAAVKVRIRDEKETNKAEWIQERVKIINRCNEKKDKEEDYEDDRMEILNTMDDREAVVWIWLKSRNALEKLKEIITKEKHKTEAEVTINVESHQPWNEIVFFPRIFADFKGTLNLEGVLSPFGRIRGATKLRNRIYVLHSDRHNFSILVFKDQNPFRLQRIINCKQFHDVVLDLTSSENQNCLYVSKLVKPFININSVIWKLETGEDERQEDKIFKYLEFDDFSSSCLTVTDEGQLLMVGKDFNESMILRIYGSDARLCLSIDLHKTVKRPSCAVQSSIGNFIVSYVNEKWAFAISELSRDGQTIIRSFDPRNFNQKIDYTFGGFRRLLIDSNDRVFVADGKWKRVIVLDSVLQWNRILISTKNKEIRSMERMFYEEKKKQFILIGENANIYTLIRK